MKFQQFFKHSCGVFVLGLAAVSFVSAQSAKSTLVVGDSAKNWPVASGNNLYCAGYVEGGKVDTNRKVVGGVNEQEQNVYTQGQEVYINVGNGSGVKAGDMFAVVRPKGRVESRWTKKNDIGFLVQEVGALEVIRVKNEVAVARVKTSCETVLLGDLIQPIAARTSPVYDTRPSFDRFADPSGKASGRIIIARDGAELITRDQIIYLDLGSEDGAKVGDFLTVFRPLGKGGLRDTQELENASARDESYQSDRFRGGKFSNMAARKSGDEANGAVVTSEAAKKDRPKDIRKIVGEAVILNVQGRTATAVITRTAQEIHTGDYVELQ